MLHGKSSQVGRCHPYSPSELVEIHPVDFKGNRSLAPDLLEFPFLLLLPEVPPIYALPLNTIYLPLLILKMSF